jgi:lipopolysaccharide export system protein LptA
LFYLADAHRQLGNQQKANEYLETLRTKYPKSIYARTTVRERKTLKVAQAQPAPAAKGEAAKQAPAPGGGPGLYPVTYGTLNLPPSIESPTIAAQAGSSAPAAPQAAEPAQASPYVERPKKVIDLRPPETEATGQTAAAMPAEVKAPSSGKPVEPAKAAGPQKPSEQVKDAGATGTGGPAKPVEMARSTAPAKPKAETGKSSDKVLGMIDQKKPIDIVSDTMEGFEKEKYVIFKGNVVAKQDDLYIYSDSMEAYMSTDTNEIDRANAKGHVRIIKQNRTATCQEAYFDNVKGEILLKGNAVVTSDKDRVEGDEVTYYVNEDRAVVTAQKSKKAKITIYPKQTK